MEIKFRCLKETILKVIQVEQDTVYIKLGLRIAVAEIKFTSTTYLHVWQFTNGALKQFLFLQRVSSTGLASTANGIE